MAEIGGVILRDNGNNDWESRVGCMAVGVGIVCYGSATCSMLRKGLLIIFSVDYFCCKIASENRILILLVVCGIERYVVD